MDDEIRIYPCDNCQESTEHKINKVTYDSGQQEAYAYCLQCHSEFQLD